MVRERLPGDHAEGCRFDFRLAIRNIPADDCKVVKTNEIKMLTVYALFKLFHRMLAILSFFSPQKLSKSKLTVGGVRGDRGVCVVRHVTPALNFASGPVLNHTQVTAVVLAGEIARLRRAV